MWKLWKCKKVYKRQKSCKFKKVYDLKKVCEFKKAYECEKANYIIAKKNAILKRYTTAKN